MEREYKGLVFAVIIALIVVAACVLSLETQLQRLQIHEGQQTVQSASVSRPVTVTLAAGQHITSTSASAVVGVGYYREALLYLSTAVVTDTITYTLQTSPDAVTWYTYSALSPMTSTQALTLPLSVAFGPYLRLSWAASATTDVTTTAVLSLKE